MMGVARLSAADFEKKIAEFASVREFKTFWLGVVLSSDMETGLSDEERLKLKQEMKKDLGMKLEKKWKAKGRAAKHDEPDILFTLDFHSRRLKTAVKSILVYGRYKKLSREIPQSKWPCRKCDGKGCSHCGGKGAMYPETVEGFLAVPLLTVSKAKSTKMHAVGREDIDARMLGTGRPFILELVEPEKRKLDLKSVEEKANALASGKAEFSKLSLVSQKELDELKSVQPDKTYFLKVECERRIPATLLKKVLSLKGKIISQKTPDRVLHRRADLVRKRKVKKISVEPLSPTSFTLTLTVQSGTYVKELVTGDKGRTTPSISELLGCECVPKELDVLDVAFKPRV